MNCSAIKAAPIGPCGPDLARKEYAISNDGYLYENGIMIGKVLDYAITSHDVHVVEYLAISKNKYLHGNIYKITSLGVKLNGN